MIPAAARRFAVFVGVAAGVSATVATLVGLAVGASVGRAVALGFYGAGSFGMIVGFALGTRASFRPASSRPRHEHDLSHVDAIRESRGAAMLLIATGVILIVLAIAVDPRARLI